MEKLDEMLQQNGFHHQLLTTGEIHSWATAPDFKTAMLWMQVNAMKEGLQPKDDTISNSLKSDYKQRIAKAISSKDWMKAHQLLEGIVATLGGLTDVSSEKKQLEEMSAGTNYKNAVALQHQIQQAEMKQQSELAQQFAAQDEQWWQKKIGELNHSSKTAKTGQEAQMYKRLINYLGLVGYMYSSQAINKGDLNHANTFLHIFKMADPKNPDCSYLIALYDMKKGNPDQAIAALQEAASLGYSEAAMMNDPVFAGIRDNPGYKEAVNKVIGNHSAK
jgi:tetratricopeptide (TPR) repeat protein